MKHVPSRFPWCHYSRKDAAIWSWRHFERVRALRRKRHTEPVEEERLGPPGNQFLAAEHNILLEKVQRALKNLPEEQRQSVQLASFEDLTHTEIAERTGEPLGTVKTRIRTALIRLRKALATC